MTGREDLLGLVLAALGNPCMVCSTAIRIVLQNPHDRHAFTEAAIGAGCTSRRLLERKMRIHGFPQLHVLQESLRLISLEYYWRSEGLSLSTQAYAAGSDPTVLGRLVKRVTGQSWLAWRAATTAPDVSQATLALLPRVHCGR